MGAGEGGGGGELGGGVMAGVVGCSRCDLKQVEPEGPVWNTTQRRDSG